MAGLAPISLQQRCGVDGKPYPGARAYFYQADSLALIEVWADFGLGTPLPNPVQANAYGVFPPIFLDEDLGFYRLRILTASGVILEDLMTLPIIGPSGGSGGAEIPVDPNVLRKTGDIFLVDGSGNRAGAVRANGRTIGSAASGATERANADCEALFLVLWGRHDNARCPVIGGRGGTASADWTAGKQLTLPDYRGRSPLGLDTMGHSAANRLSGVTFEIGDAGTPGSVGGAARVTLTVDQMPIHNHGITDPGHPHDYDDRYFSASRSGDPGGWESIGNPTSQKRTTDPATTGITINNAGGGQPHTVLDPFFTVTWYYQL